MYVKGQETQKLVQKIFGMSIYVWNTKWKFGFVFSLFLITSPWCTIVQYLSKRQNTFLLSTDISNDNSSKTTFLYEKKVQSYIISWLCYTNNWGTYSDKLETLKNKKITCKPAPNATCITITLGYSSDVRNSFNLDFLKNKNNN